MSPLRYLIPVTQPIYFLATLLAPFLLAISEPAYGDESKQPSEIEVRSITLSVRTIQASEPQDGEEIKGRSDRAIKLDEGIRDLEIKLAQLPFNNFQLLAAKVETMTLKTRNSMQLPNGHSLTFRPIYLDSNRAGLWLNWRDEGGSEVLNTRVHFDSSDSVLTGTDCAHKKGLILAIAASAGPR